MRADGRTPAELRPVQIDTDVQSYAEGSALITCGATRVLCAATVEDTVPAWMRGQGRGWVTGEYGMLPRSTQTRIDRARASGSSRTQEIRRLIGRALRAAVDLSALGERTVTLDCDVIQADGGTRTASVTGGYVALALALRPLIAAGLIPAGVLRTPIAAVSVGIVAGEPLLDLCYTEDSTAEVDMNVVMDGHGCFVEVQGTAEGQPFSRAELDALLDLATGGIAQLLVFQQQALAETKL